MDRAGVGIGWIQGLPSTAAGPRMSRAEAGIRRTLSLTLDTFDSCFSARSMARMFRYRAAPTIRPMRQSLPELPRSEFIAVMEELRLKSPPFLGLFWTTNRRFPLQH